MADNDHVRHELGGSPKPRIVPVDSENIPPTNFIAPLNSALTVPAAVDGVSGKTIVQAPTFMSYTFDSLPAGGSRTDAVPGSKRKRTDDKQAPIAPYISGSKQPQSQGSSEAIEILSDSEDLATPKAKNEVSDLPSESAKRQDIKSSPEEFSRSNKIYDIRESCTDAPSSPQVDLNNSHQPASQTMTEREEGGVVCIDSSPTPNSSQAFNPLRYSQDVPHGDDVPHTGPTIPPAANIATNVPSSSQDPPQAVPTGGPPIEPPEPPLCPEQADLVDLIMSGRNVFYTGSAGCGKSTVLRAFTKRLAELGKTVHIVAPTGRAALQVGGSTTWTFAGWTPDHHKRPLENLRQDVHRKLVWRRITGADVLVIDEISMVENLHFERLNHIMKEARYNPNVDVQPAFGGVQLIVTGDFCQLPPVKPFQHCIYCGKELVEKMTNEGVIYSCLKCRIAPWRDEDKWAFRSDAWTECDFAHVHLKTIHRQSDQEFIGMLQKCRSGDQLKPAEIDRLMNHECMVHNGTKLFATRNEVQQVNQANFRKLTGENHTYWCRDEFVWNPRHPHLQWKGQRTDRGPADQKSLKTLDDHRYDALTELKPGMLVVLLVNLDLTSGLCNGSQGIICGFENYDPAKLPKYNYGMKDNWDPEVRIKMERANMKETEIKKFIEGPGARLKRWPVIRFHNGQTRTIFADCSINELGDDKPYTLMARTQIPLAPAWAMTIHKSQSLTLERVIVNLSKAFEEGQVYVALSRATSLHGLKIEGDYKGLSVGLGGNKEVQEFLRTHFGVNHADTTPA